MGDGSRLSVCVVSGSRADAGLLAWPIRVLEQDREIAVTTFTVYDEAAGEALGHAERFFEQNRFDWVLLLGDRFEILAVALAAHLQRLPIAHLCGGDVTKGSYDDAMRDCISRLATLHFVTNDLAVRRLQARGYSHVYLVGNPGADYLLHGDWRRERPQPQPYILVSYQPETESGTSGIEAFLAGLPLDIFKIFLLPNPDYGSDVVTVAIVKYCMDHTNAMWTVAMTHDNFLNHLAHCDEFIGNSSAMFYEAPLLGVKIRLIGTRQTGRVEPWGDGHASERIRDLLKQQARGSA